MVVGDDDRRRMARLARSLAEAETDEAADAGTLTQAVAWADEWRLRAGLPPLVVDDQPSEEEFYRRARALGLRRCGR